MTGNLGAAKKHLSNKDAAAVAPRWWSRKTFWINTICVVFLLVFFAAVTNNQWIKSDPVADTGKAAELTAPVVEDLIEIRNESGAKHSQVIRVVKDETVRIAHTFGRAN